MRIVSYRTAAGVRAGVVFGERVVDAVGPAAHIGIALDAAGTSMSVARQLLALGREGLERVEAAARAVGDDPGTCADVHRLADIEFTAPIPDPGKILCIGLNYRDHADEVHLDVGQFPPVFTKFTTSLTGHGSPVVMPVASSEVDYEGELAVVIGRTSKHLSLANALDAVAGYMVLNDVSARDLQMASSQWTMGKALDDFAPCGPALVTTDEVGDPQALDLTTKVNGQVVQQASTAQMIHPVADILVHLTAAMTLEAGDVIATGTPSGVGYARDPQLFLSDGDRVDIEISNVGHLHNQFRSPDPEGTR